MSRDYTQLPCGCLISCSGGGGLIQGCGRWDEKESIIIPDKNCKVKEYLNKHNTWCGGYCKICSPFEFNDAKLKGEKVWIN